MFLPIRQNSICLVWTSICLCLNYRNLSLFSFLSKFNCLEYPVCAHKKSWCCCPCPVRKVLKVHRLHFHIAYKLALVSSTCTLKEHTQHHITSSEGHKRIKEAKRFTLLYAYKITYAKKEWQNIGSPSAHPKSYISHNGWIKKADKK